MAKKIKKKIRDDLFSFYVSVGLFVVFLALWVVTSDSSIIDDKHSAPFENLSVTDQINVVQEEEQRIEDESMYSLAIASNNPFYCDEIESKSQRNDCLSAVSGEYSEPVSDTRTEQDVEDEAMHALAIALNDASFCNSISDNDLKDECLSRFS